MTTTIHPDKNLPLKGIVIGVDIDAVCADHNEEFRKYVAADLGVTPEDLGDVEDWHYNSWGLDREDFLRIHPDAVRRGLFRDMKPMPNVANTLRELNDAGAHIRIITHRLYVKGNHEPAVVQTGQWLEKNNIPYNDLCMIEDKYAVDADIYIDDSPTNINNLRSMTGKPVVIFDQVYNRDLPGPRISNWSEMFGTVMRETGRESLEKQQAFDFTRATDADDHQEVDGEADDLNGLHAKFVLGAKSKSARHEFGSSFCNARNLDGSTCRRLVGHGKSCPMHQKIKS